MKGNDVCKNTKYKSHINARQLWAAGITNFL